MRLDKFLKVSRLIKRRTVANEACGAGRVLVNGKAAKAGTNVKPGDRIDIQFGNRETAVEVLSIAETVKKDEAADLYKFLQVCFISFVHKMYKTFWEEVLYDRRETTFKST